MSRFNSLKKCMWEMVSNGLFVMLLGAAICLTGCGGGDAPSTAVVSLQAAEPLVKQFDPSIVNETDEKTLTMAVYQTDKATLVYNQFQPVVDAIEQAIQVQGEDVNVELKIYKSYEEARQALIAGQVDFARVGPASYVLIQQEDPKQNLLAVEKKKGQTTFNGLIVVRADRSIQTIGDLRGKKMAFGDPSSTIGRYLSQALLIENGVFGPDLKSYSFLGRHDKVLQSVVVGDFDAGALKESTYKKSPDQNQLRILVTFENVTKPWIGSSSLSEQKLKWLRRSLVEMPMEQAKQTFGVDGFVVVGSEHFDPIRDAMNRAQMFGKRPEFLDSDEL